MNDYPLEVQRAEETRYQFTPADEIAQVCEDARRSARMLGTWLVVVAVVLAAIALCFVRRH